MSVNTAVHARQVNLSNITNWVALVLCWNFVILFGIWLQPHTVFIRHASLIIGAALGIWVIAKNWKLLLQANALPIWLIGLLIVWVTIHLLLIGQDHSAQLFEYVRIWKKVALSIPFGIGLGVCLLSCANQAEKTAKYWRIIYLGLLSPSLIYFIKRAATKLSISLGYKTPVYLLLSPDHMSDIWGVSRAAYVFFCMPAYFVAIAQLSKILTQSDQKFGDSFLYGIAFIAVPAIMFIENDRTGVLYCALGILLELFIFIKNSKFNAKGIRRVAIVLALLALFVAFVVTSLQRNPLWGTLAADAKLAVQVEKYDNWKHLKTAAGSPPLLNELGVPVAESNFDRIAWAIRGSQLIPRYPLGYGLMTLSFGRLNVIDFPDSQTNMSHSAWLDFTLGYGIPGFLLLFGAACLALKNAKNAPLPWQTLIRWTLGFMALLFFTKELSSEIFVNALVFMVVWFATMSIRNE